MIQMKEWLFKAYLHKLYRMLYRRRAGTVYEKKKASEREDSARRYTCHLSCAACLQVEIYSHIEMHSHRTLTMFTSGNLLSSSHIAVNVLVEYSKEDWRNWAGPVL